jgi:hypothetical protein
LARLGLSIVISGVFATAFVGAQVTPAPIAQVERIPQKTDQQKVVKAPIVGDDRARAAKLKDAISKLPANDPANAVAARALVLVRQRENLIVRYQSLGRPFVRAELIFVRHICSIGQDKFRQLSRDADLVLKDVVTKVVDTVLEQRRKAGIPNPDSGKLLQDALTALMKRSLSSEQWATYRAEREKRETSRKPIAIRFLVSAIDRELYLTDRQRALLTESFTAHWDDAWNIYLDYMLQGNSFYPANIDSVVSPILSEMQRKLWQGSQRVNVTPVFGGQLGRFGQDTDALEEERGEVSKIEPGNAEMERLAIEARVQELELRADAVARRARAQERKAELKRIEIKTGEMKKAGGR